MKRTIRWLALAAMTLTALAGMKTALAYFTTYVVAKGAKPLVLGGETSIEESFSSWTKHVRITAAGPGSVFVRVRAFADEGLTLVYTSDGSWRQDGDWWYYTPALRPGERSEELLVRINDVPTRPEIGQSIQVVVVQESTPAHYRADGTAYADWTKATGGVTP